MVRLHDMVRSKIIHENSIRVLSELCEILYLQLPEGSKEENLIRGKHLSKNRRDRYLILSTICDYLDGYHDISEAYFGVIRTIIEDIQHRLVFRAQAYIRDEIERYQSNPPDLDYPDPSKASNTRIGSVGDTDEQALEIGGPKSDPSWFPTLFRSLDLLSKLYCSIKVGLFPGSSSFF